MKFISLSFFVIWMILVLGTACAPTRALITHHHGDVVVVHVNKDLSKSDRIESSGTNIGSVEICREFYRHYRDEFDILVLVSNVTQSESIIFKPRDHERYIYFKGAMVVVNNQTKGIGKELFDKTAVLDGPKKLKGVMLVPVLSDFMDGPVLHELMHIWGGGDVIPTAFDSHWGFSSVYGQLGGFDRKKLKKVGDGLYTAGKFGVRGVANNFIPYAPLELYLAGWISASEVPDTLIAENVKWVQQNDDGWIFSATGWNTLTIEDIVARIGERIPSYETAQAHFKMAVILVESDDFPVDDEDINEVSKYIDWFTQTASARDIPGREGWYNFWDATGGRATIEAPDLRLYRISTESTEVAGSSAE